VGAALLERPLVKPELTPKLDKLLDMLEAELDTVEVRKVGRHTKSTSVCV
jgi:hypothetical protein